MVHEFSIKEDNDSVLAPASLSVSQSKALGKLVCFVG